MKLSVSIFPFDQNNTQRLVFWLFLLVQLVGGGWARQGTGCVEHANTWILGRGIHAKRATSLSKQLRLISQLICTTHIGWMETLPGDWCCQSINCGAHNYASQTSWFQCGNINPITMLLDGATDGDHTMMSRATSEYCSQQLLPR